MILPYWEELRGEKVRLFSVAPITLHYRKNSLDVSALIDSGAEQNVFPLEAAADLGYDLSGHPEVMIVGAGGKHTPGRVAILDYQVGDYRWRAPAIFSRAVNDRPLLSQAGFFAFFTVTFRHARRDIKIKQTPSPRLQI